VDNIGREGQTPEVEGFEGNVPGRPVLWIRSEVAVDQSMERM
jgi:hypothetical protein